MTVTESHHNASALPSLRRSTAAALPVSKPTSSELAHSSVHTHGKEIVCVHARTPSAAPREAAVRAAIAGGRGVGEDVFGRLGFCPRGTRRQCAPACHGRAPMLLESETATKRYKSRWRCRATCPDAQR